MDWACRTRGRPPSKQLRMPETEMLGRGRHYLKSRCKDGEPDRLAACRSESNSQSTLFLTTDN